jgi:hypothetical protein
MQRDAHAAYLQHVYTRGWYNKDRANRFGKISDISGVPEMDALNLNPVRIVLLYFFHSRMRLNFR